VYQVPLSLFNQNRKDVPGKIANAILQLLVKYPLRILLGGPDEGKAFT
jgi:hypothetical protein